MKKKVLLISLALVLVAAIFAPVSVLAKGWNPPKPSPVQKFNAVMTPTAIDPTVPAFPPTTWPTRETAETNAWPIIDLIDGKATVVGWIIDGRSVYGSVSGGFTGNGSFTYGGVLDTLQSGSMSGVLTIQTAQGVLYMGANGTLDANVTAYYSFEELVGLYTPAVLPMVLAAIYSTPALALLHDGDLAFEEIQAFCAGIGVSVGEFFAGVYGVPDLAALPEEALAAMYGDTLPILQGLVLLGGMYGSDSMPSLPKIMTAEFKGTLEISAGTGVYSGASGKGTFGPNNRTPLTLYVSPDQHVENVEGSIKLTGTYSKKLPHFFKLDKENLDELTGELRDHFGKNIDD